MRAGIALLLVAGTGFASEAPAPLAPVVVTAARAPQQAANVPSAVDIIDRTRLRDSPALTIDGTLRESAAFSLFRRSGSLFANPTAQGVSLRGVGPSGASRSLVLLDGVPLNDPFGGWVAWNKLPRDSIDRIEIVRGGGSSVWGNASLSGTIQLLTAKTPGTGAGIDGGSFGLRSANAVLSHWIGNGTAVLDAAKFSFDGFEATDPARRGSVDRPLDSGYERLHASWHGGNDGDVEISVTARHFSEDRGNGTPLQRNSSRENFAAVSLGSTGRDDFLWDATAYFQRQHFAAFFSAVSADRSAETPANDQFDVPSTAAGAAFQATWRDGDRASTTAGADIRTVAGETKENFFFSAGRFQRRRIAGGEQTFAGAFIHHERAIREGWRATVGARVDHWRNRDGRRRETILQTGSVVRDDRFAPADGYELSPTIGIVRRFTGSVRGRASVYRAFRVPTLNEFHRPFRVGNVNTEANADLRRETLAGAEIGADWAFARGRVSATVFSSSLRDSVANVTLSRTPALISRQRRNLGRVRVRGAELSAEFRPHPTLQLRADILFNDAEVERAAAQPALEGLRVPQVPRTTISAGVDWQAPLDFSIGARVRHTGRQFEDDENRLPLAPATQVDIRITRRLNRRSEAFVAVENVFDARIETGIGSGDLLQFGAPRLARAGVRFEW